MVLGTTSATNVTILQNKADALLKEYEASVKTTDAAIHALNWARVTLLNIKVAGLQIIHESLFTWECAFDPENLHEMPNPIDSLVGLISGAPDGVRNHGPEYSEVLIAEEHRIGPVLSVIYVCSRLESVMTRLKRGADEFKPTYIMLSRDIMQPGSRTVSRIYLGAWLSFLTIHRGGFP